MYGFFSRVDQWFKAAAEGELDPENAPLHPPAVFPTVSVWYIPYKNTPEIPVGAGNWVGVAGLKKHSDSKFDILGWIPEGEQSPEGLDTTPAVLIDRPLAHEYPDKVEKLFDLLETSGVDRSILNNFFVTRAYDTKLGEPLDIVVGSPMRRKAEGEPLRQHLSVWRIPSDAMDLLRKSFDESEDRDEHIKSFVVWSHTATTGWCYVLENRPEIVIRRDENTPSSWLRDRSILLLGAGALGAPIAEDILRAGAKQLHVVDDGTVKPGVLVRQRYSKQDVARSKANCLAKRLNDLALECEVIPHFENATHGLPSYVDLTSIDLIIDATASQAVAHYLERLAGNGNLNSPLASLSVSAKAEHGMVTLCMPNFVGGPIELVRRSKLAVFSGNQIDTSAAAFWPAQDSERIFQPEPGCSEPTFVGSATDVSFHASGLLQIALRRLTSLPDTRASCDFLPGAASKMGDYSDGPKSFVFSLSNQDTEHIYKYHIRISAEAESAISSEIARSRRVSGIEVETGGLLFGEIDDSHKTIWLDRATEPPADSEASATQFLCGTSGTYELAQSVNEQSKGSSRFVGIWHTHPVSQPNPSNDDLEAMVHLLLEQDRTPRHVVMMIVGFAATAPVPKYYLYRKRDIEAFVLAYLRKEGLVR